ncbi:MAG: hypothetical protein KDA85_15500, partial [Planctomycetaceae bacterium]|nr:hypothetical protein [Planctomycetaceae bacterium]
LQESGLITESSTCMLRLTWVDSHYVVQWFLTPASVNQNHTAIAEAAANRLASSSLQDIPFVFAICDLQLALVGDNAWTNSDEATDE